ncbi:MAG: 4-alpha-glucanotransferase [Qingshengfaniella sp.]
MTGPVAELARRAGILSRYRGTDQRWVDVPPETIVAVLSAMGLPADGAGAAAFLSETGTSHRLLPHWHVAGLGRAPDLSLPEDAVWALCLEDGTQTEGRGPTVPPLPLGRHNLTCGAETCWVLVAPPALSDLGRGWGLTVPLYGLRAPAMGGLGDFGDLGLVMAGLAAVGAGFVGINPIHAGFPTAPEMFSPYAPSSRRRLNPLHLRCGADDQGRGSDLVDYPASTGTRLASFRAAFQGAALDPAFQAWRAQEGPDLQRFATHQAISGVHGPLWHRWPAALQDPDAAEVAAFAGTHGEDIGFHAWLQWQAEGQLGLLAEQARALSCGLYLDLAVGTHPYGAETWAAPAQFVRGVSLGAPPDGFAPEGQTWGLAPFNPLTLAAQGFAPLAETLRCQLRFARLLRIDHVLGFERAFWVPEGGGLPGTYVTMPRAAMLAVARIEATRAGATLIGEDLGNIPEGLQEALANSGILGCRVAQFERHWQEDGRFRAAADYPADTLASFGTHDLPTWAGWRAGRDIGVGRDLGRIGAEQAEIATAARMRDVAAFDRVAGTGTDGDDALNSFLARTGSRLVALQIEDILGLADQPNLPGTVDEYPNWRRRLPLGPAEFVQDPRLLRAADIMARNGRRT